jgi:hypothetical protein
MGDTDISFENTVDGSHALVVETGGTTTFQGNIGVTAVLTKLFTDAGGTTKLSSDVIVSDELRFEDDVEAVSFNSQKLDASTGVLIINSGITKTGAGHLAFGGDLDIDLDGHVLVQNGDLVIEDAFSAASDLQASSDIILEAAATLDGAWDQTINAVNGILQARSIIYKPFSDLTLRADTIIDLDGDVQVDSGHLVIEDPVDVEGNLTAGNRIFVNSTCFLAGNITAIDNVQFDRDVIADGLADQVFTTSVGILEVRGNLTKANGDLTLDSGSLINIEGVINVDGSLSVDNNIDAEDDLVASGSIVIRGVANFAGDITTGHDITFEDNVTADRMGGQRFEAVAGTLCSRGIILKNDYGDLTLRGNYYGGVGVDLAGSVSNNSGNLMIIAGEGDIEVNGDLTAISGGISVVSHNGSIYTDDGSSMINIDITGSSNGTYGIALPNSGKAAILLHSKNDLKLGSDAFITAEGEYDPTAIDDRQGVNFLDHVEGIKEPGKPIDIAVYLVSTEGNTYVGSGFSLVPSGGTMVIDAEATVSFGSTFEDDLANRRVDRLEACSRVTVDLGSAIANNTLPFASNPGSVARWFPNGYVLRGENPDVGTGAWVLYETEITPILLYVDNDAPDDPGPNNPALSDPNEVGSVAHPFDAIQEAVDIAYPNDVVVVLDGVYTGIGNSDIDLSGKAITLRSADGPSHCIIDCNGSEVDLRRAFRFNSSEGTDTVIEGLTITNGSATNGGGILCEGGSSPTISGCVIARNIASGSGGGIYGCQGILTHCVIYENHTNGTGGGLYDCSFSIINCTISENTASISGGGISNCGGSISNSIIWANSAPVDPQLHNCSSPNYSCIQDWLGGGNSNLVEDPRFVDAIYDDYHLKSVVGRWYPNSQIWVVDSISSPCIDMGDTSSDWTPELWPHGSRINLGAYGGTPEASMSRSHVGNPCDFNHDGSIDWLDLSRLTSKWLVLKALLAESLDRDHTVDFDDFAICARDWQKKVAVILYDFQLDIDPGWTTQGEWQFGQPTGGGGASGNPDPTDGYTGSNVYGVNLNGDYRTAVGGPYYLTSEQFDCTGHYGLNMKFARWLNTDFPPYVRTAIEVSNDGAVWETIWEQQQGQVITDSTWQFQEYDISSTADNQPMVQIRWSYEILDSQAYSYSGWNLDDIQIWGTP